MKESNGKKIFVIYILNAGIPDIKLNCINQWEIKTAKKYKNLKIL